MLYQYICVFRVAFNALTVKFAVHSNNKPLSESRLNMLQLQLYSGL